MEAAAPSFAQSEEDIRQLIIAACSVEPGAAGAGKPEKDLLMEEYRVSGRREGRAGGFSHGCSHCSVLIMGV